MHLYENIHSKVSEKQKDFKSGVVFHEGWFSHRGSRQPQICVYFQNSTLSVTPAQALAMS